jgi:hypothetical protein
LKQASVDVFVGQDVQEGQLLAKVGNSGYSPVPHLHVQVQTASGTDAATLPFSLGGVEVARQYRQAWVPVQGALVEAAPQDAAVRWATSFKLDDTLVFEVSDASSNAKRRLSLKVRMGWDGCFYLDSGTGQLWFSADALRFKVLSVTGNDPDLDALAIALPSLPFVRNAGGGAGSGLQVAWHDTVPARAVLALQHGNRVQRWLAQSVQELAGWWMPARATARYAARWGTPDTVEARVNVARGFGGSPDAVVDGHAVPITVRFGTHGIEHVRCGGRSFGRVVPTGIAARST